MSRSPASTTSVLRTYSAWTMGMRRTEICTPLVGRATMPTAESGADAGASM